MPLSDESLGTFVQIQNWRQAAVSRSMSFTSGPLKLKGGVTLTGAVKKKKKKAPEGAEAAKAIVAADGSPGAAGTSSSTPENASKQLDVKKIIHGEAVPERSEAEDRRTEAEKRFEARQIQLEAERLKKLAGKSHRDRVKDFNDYLAKLSAQPLPAAPGPVPSPQAPPWGRWLDRDTNACFNFQRIGESTQRPLELCSWKDREALPPVGKEYQQGCKQSMTGCPSRRCIVARGRAPLRVLAAATPKLRLIYFGLPGRAETIRVLLNVGNIPFEDYIISREQWAEMKPTMPYGQVPVLEVDGKQLAQSSAIERYAARLAGLYPQDAWEAAKVDEIASFMNEWLDAFVSTFSIKDADERLAARKAVAQGPLQTKMTKLNMLLTEAGPDGYLVGGRMTYADVAVYVMTSNIVCGFFDGVPHDLYRPFPAITAFHTRMASVPQIRDMYQGPGKAELTRVLLNVGKIPFDDHIISREQWAELKPTMPYGQIPVLEVDGKQLAQSSAIERYAARLAGLYPQDAWEAAKVDELACFMGEWMDDFVRVFYIKDADEKLAARKAIVEGALQTRMTKLNTLLTEAGPDGYLVGGRMTYAAVAVYVMTSNIICGFFGGVPHDLYRPFPAITAFHTRMASVPQIRDMYQGPGRAEVTRVLLTIGKVPFDYCTISREQWAEVKPTLPYGQLPVLEVDGKQLAQSSAIERYAARLAGLYPQDAWEAAKADELVCFMREWLEDIVSTVFIKSADEKLAARKAMVEGPLQTRMTKLNTLLTEAGQDGYLVGGRMTYADVALFVTMSFLICGFFDGVPRDLYRPFPAITAFHTRMASVPQIRDMYQGPGKAEVTRVLLHVGKIPYEDYTISREQWAEVKPTMPYGQVPVLEVDGKQLAQSSAIERYAARLAGLYPQDAWEAAKVDELACFMSEWLEDCVRTFYIKDADEKLAACKAMVEGPLQTRMTKLNTLLVRHTPAPLCFTTSLPAPPLLLRPLSHPRDCPLAPYPLPGLQTEAGPDGYLVGGRMTYADVAVYVMTSNIICGFLDGVPRDLYRPFPAITAFHTRMASVPQIRDMYQGVTEGVRMAVGLYFIKLESRVLHGMCKQLGLTKVSKAAFTSEPALSHHWARWFNTALWLDGDLMHHLTRPLRLNNVAEALKCRGIRNASAPHRVQPVRRKAAKLDERLGPPDEATQFAARVLCRPMYVGASGSGLQEVVGERRQVIKAAIRSLVEAARPDLSPAQVDALVAEMNKRITMGSKQCCITAVLCLSMLLQSFLGQPTEGFPAAGPAPGAPPPPDPACPPYTHPRLATRSSPRSAAASAQLPPPVPLNIWDPKLLAQINDAMELLTTARVLQHLMRGPHHSGIRLAGIKVAVSEQPSSAWPVAKLKELDEVHLTGDGNSLDANATTISTSIKEFYRHPGRFIKWWGKAIGVVEGGFSRAAQKHSPQLVLGRLDYSLPDREHKWRLPANSVLRQPRWVAEVAKHRSLLGLEARMEGVDCIGLEGWQQHGTCPRPFTMLPMVGVRARHFVTDGRVLHGVLADLGMTTLTRAQVEADSLPQWQRFIQYSQLQNSGWDFARRVETDGVSISVHFVRSQVVREPVELPFTWHQLTATSHFNHTTHNAIGVDPGVTQAIKAGHAQRDPVTGQVEEYLKPRWRRQRLGLHHAQERVIEGCRKKAQPLPAAPGPVPPPQAPPWGRWLDRDTNACFNFQRIGESTQRPLELCSWKDREALPPIGKEYQQRYKRVNDRLPKRLQQRVETDSVSVCIHYTRPVPPPPAPPPDARSNSRPSAAAAAAAHAMGLPHIGKGIAQQREFVFDTNTQIGVGIDPGVTQTVSAASGIRGQASWKLTKGQHLAAASSAGTSLVANLKRITVTLATGDALEEDMAEVSMERHGRAKQLVVFFGAAGIGTGGGWGADAVLRACCKVRIGESRWRPLELCWWLKQTPRPAKGKEYPGLDYKRLRDKPPKARQQQQQQLPAVAQQCLRASNSFISIFGCRALFFMGRWGPMGRSWPTGAAAMCHLAAACPLSSLQPGKAEVTRVLLNVGKIPFEDYTISREQWAELKPTMPYGQVPVLEVDGKQLAQSSAIERYAARLAGLYPQDAWEAAKVDELACFMSEWLEDFVRTFYIKDADEKLAARKAIVEGALQTRMTKLNTLLTEAGPDGYLVGGRMTYADVAVYVMTSNIICGFLDGEIAGTANPWLNGLRLALALCGGCPSDLASALTDLVPRAAGVPRDLYRPFPAITAFHTRMASVPQIRDMYQGVTEGRVPRALCPLSSLQPGRAELTRVLLNVGNIPFEDYIISREQWAELKPTMPYGQIPVLEVGADEGAGGGGGGQAPAAASTWAVLLPDLQAVLGCRWTASSWHRAQPLSAMQPGWRGCTHRMREWGLEPVYMVQNAYAPHSLHMEWEAAKVDELACFMQEWWELFISTFSITDADERLAARKAVAQGPLQTKIAKLNALLTEAGQDGYLVGGRMTYADVAVYVLMSGIVSGFLEGEAWALGVPSQPAGASWWPPCLVHSDLASALTALVPLAAGVPRDLYRPFPAIIDFHTRMASVPQIEDMYQGVTEGVRMAFKAGCVA
ncbi:hypothetical protein QJQ45_029067 [Haematococcus lacustris]|nr:hypothetical protein QJQ45_029067 [Haematococcus lacustris]